MTLSRLQRDDGGWKPMIEIGAADLKSALDEAKENGGTWSITLELDPTIDATNEPSVTGSIRIGNQVLGISGNLKRADAGGLDLEVGGDFTLHFDESALKVGCILGWKEDEPAWKQLIGPQNQFFSASATFKHGDSWSLGVTYTHDPVDKQKLTVSLGYSFPI